MNVKALMLAFALGMLAALLIIRAEMWYRGRKK